MKVNRQRLSVGSFFYTIETSIHKTDSGSLAIRKGGKASEKRCHESCHVQRAKGTSEEKETLSRLKDKEHYKPSETIRRRIFEKFKTFFD